MPPKIVSAKNAIVKNATKTTKKVRKDVPKFVQGKIIAPGIRYAGKDVFTFKVTAENAKYTDMYQHVNVIKDKLASKYPTAKMNVAIKYSSMSKPISAGYFSVDDDADVKAPYDYADEDDDIEHFYISFVE